MRLTKKRLAGAAAMAGGALALRPGTRAHRVMRDQLRRVERKMRYARGEARGMRYHLRGNEPDPNVADDILADRIRSSIGGLEKRLDLPHIHVMVHDHIAMLHGEVATAQDAVDIEAAVRAVSGVAGVESYLHVGLLAGDSRPSEGADPTQPSPALAQLLDAAIGAGAGPLVAPRVVRAVLASFADRVPEGERAHVASHLPGDVRVLFAPPRRLDDAPAPKLRTVDELVAAVCAGSADVRADSAPRITEAVITTLAALVPDERSDFASVLPADLRGLWLGEPATRQ